MIILSELVYKVLLVENDDLVSPFAVKLFKRQYKVQNEIKTVDYGFAFQRIEEANSLIYQNCDSNLEIWVCEVDDYIPVSFNIHPYRLFNQSEYLEEDIGTAFFDQELSRIKIVKVHAIPGSIFCKKIRLTEKYE